MSKVQVGEHYSLPVAAETLPFLRLKVGLVSGVPYFQVAGVADRSVAISESHVVDCGPNAGGMMSGLCRGWPGVKYYKASKSIAVNSKIYGAASGLVTDVNTPGAEYLGIAMTAGVTNGLIEVMPSDEVVDLNAAIVAASSAVTNTTTQTAFDQTISIPANELQVGDVIHITGQAIATATNSTDTLTLELDVGGVAVVTTAAVDVANNDIGFFDAYVTVRTIGASGTIVGTGTQGLGTPGTVTAKPFKLASTTLDTTAANAVAVKAQWSVANAGNSCRLDHLAVSILR